jgi:hypothetical protein
LLHRVSKSIVRLLASAACVAAFSCGRTSHDDTPEISATGGSATLGSGGSASESDEGGRSTVGSAGASDVAVAIDAADCVQRPLADCTGVEPRYGSDSGFEDTQALVECAEFNPHDGCGTLIFAFDAEGCASSVSPGRSGWKRSDHLSGLQACLTDALSRARFACLASSTLRYEESCLIR